MKKFLMLVMLGSAICSSDARAQVYDITDYGWLEYGGHSYAATFAVGPWADAQAEAEAIGGNLVTINDAAENAWVYEITGLINPSSSWWLGLTGGGGAWQGRPASL